MNDWCIQTRINKFCEPERKLGHEIRDNNTDRGKYCSFFSGITCEISIGMLRTLPTSTNYAKYY